MNTDELNALLDRLRAEAHETEWLEFKADHYKPQGIGEYISAIANSACLRGKAHGYIVFGIENQTHHVVGTSFDPETKKEKGNQDLLLWLAVGLHPNVGSFLPGGVEEVIHQDAPLEIYRNPFLAEAMVNLNMIDTQGGGIKRMFQTQAKRFFPLPDYDLSSPERVAVRIEGRILDERYSQLLMEKADLDLWTIMLIDKIQKGVRVSKRDTNRLRKAGLVEGRYPNLVISARVAAATGKQAEHIRKRGFDNTYYRHLLLELIWEHGPIDPHTIDELFMKTLPDVLTKKQKMAKIRNLTYDLAHRRGLIRNIGALRGRGARWTVTENVQTNTVQEEND